MTGTGDDRGEPSVVTTVDRGQDPLGSRSPFAVWGAVCLGTVVAAVAWVSTSLLQGDESVQLGAAVRTVLVVLGVALLLCLLPAAIGLMLVTLLDAARRPRSIPPALVACAAVVVAAAFAPLYDMAVPFTVVPAAVGAAAGLAVLRCRSVAARAVIVAVGVAGMVVLGRIVPLVWF